MNEVRIQAEDFDLSQEVAQLRAGNAKVGGIVTFVGTVRDLNEGASVAEMELEHYPGMTEQSIQAIIDQAKARWPIYGRWSSTASGRSSPWTRSCWWRSLRRTGARHSRLANLSSITSRPRRRSGRRNRRRKAPAGLMHARVTTMR